MAEMGQGKIDNEKTCQAFLCNFLENFTAGGVSSYGAHYLLQTRIAVLNDELHENFSRWFPQFNIKNQTSALIGMGKEA